MTFFSASFAVMLVLALASPKFLSIFARLLWPDRNLDDGLLAALAVVRQQEIDPPVGAVLPEPFSLCSFTLTCPEDNPQDILQESSQDCPEDKSKPIDAEISQMPEMSEMLEMSVV